MAEPTVQEQKELIAFQEKGVASNSAPLQKEDVDTLNMMDKQKVDADAKVESKIQEMKDKGTTKEEFLATAESLGEDYVVNQDLINRIAGELPSEEKAPLRESAVLPEREEGLKRPDNLELNYDNVDIASATDFESEDIEIGFLEAPDISLNRTSTSIKELSSMSSIITGEDPIATEEILKSGDDSPVEVAMEQIQQELDSFSTDYTTQQIVDAQTPEAVIGILEKLRSEGKTTVNLGTLRTYTISKMEGVAAEQMGYVSQNINRNIVLAQEIQKRTNEINASTSFLDALGDFSEYFSPSATYSEQVIKYKESVPEILERIQNAPPAKQEEIFYAALDGWTEQETALIGNNNSFMTIGQLSAFRESILEGGLDLINNTTNAEKGQYAESALDGVLALTGYKGVKGLFSFLSKKIFAQDDVISDPKLMAQMFDPNIPSKNTIGENQAFWNKETEFVDRRKALAEAAATKDTRLFKKTLDAEKQSLVNRSTSILEAGDNNKKARALAKEKKIKFKSALKGVQAEQDRLLAEIQSRQDVVDAQLSKFDEAAAAESELSRIRQFLSDGRMSKEDLLEPTGNVEVKLGTRTDSHIIDTEYLIKPLNKLEIEKEGGLKKVVEVTGMTKEQIASRQIFTPTGDVSIGLPNMLDSIVELNELILVDKDLINLGMSRARDLEKQAGTSLTPIHSATGFKANDLEDSAGTFTFLMGDGAKGGFKTADEAFNAQRIGLAGVDAKVVQKDGVWYSEATIVHKFDPSRDVGGLYLHPDKYMGIVGRSLLDPLRVLGGDILKGLFALKGKNRSIVQKMENRYKTVQKLDVNQGVSLAKVLEKGDMDEAEWGSFIAFKKATGESSQEVYEAYRTVRNLYSDVFEIRNKTYHQKLSSANVKFINDGVDGNLGTILDPNTLTKKVTTKGVTKVKGDQVWDIETKKLVEATPNDGFNYVKLTNPIDGGEGIGKWDIARVKPESISKLPERILNKRDGHIDRFYRDTGWVVKKTATTKVNGVEKETTEVTHIFGTEKEARALENAEEGISASRARENDELDGLFGQDNSVQFSYGSSHTKKRGEQLRGSDGIKAPILNVFESLGRSINSTQGSLDFNMLKSVETRFYNEFGDMFTEKSATSFNAVARTMLSKSGSEVSKKRLNEFKNWHSYIVGLRSHANGELFKSADEWLSPVFDPILKVAGKGTDTQAAVNSFKSLTSQLYVVLNPLFQIPQNLLVAAYITATKGAAGGKAFIQFPALLAAKSSGNYKALAKLTGGDEALARQLVEELDNNGLIDAVGRSNDILDMSRGGGGLGSAGQITKTKEGVTKAKNVVKRGLSALNRNTTGLAYDASKGGQEYTISAMNIMSYLAEFNVVMAKKGAKFNGKAKAEITFQAQKGTQTQNSLNKFEWQDSSRALSVPLQFFQHIAKIYLDLVLDPQYKLVTSAIDTARTGKLSKGKSIGLDEGAYSRTYSQALATTLLTTSLFGMQGMFGQKMGGAVEDKIRTAFPELNDVPIFEIVMNGVINETFNGILKSEGIDGGINATATIGPAALIDMAHEFLIKDFPYVNLAGVSGATAGTLFESASSIMAIMKVPEMDTFTKITSMASEIAEPISGLKNIEKAVIGYLFQTFPYTSTLSSNLRIEKSEAAMMIMNIQPALVSDFFARSSFESKTGAFFNAFNDEGVAKNTANAMIQAMTREMAYEKLMGRFDAGTPERLLEKWSGYAQSATNPNFEDVVKKAFKDGALTKGTPVYDEYLAPYWESTQIGTRAEGMRLLGNKIQSPEAKRAWDAAMETAVDADSMNEILKERNND